MTQEELREEIKGLLKQSGKTRQWLADEVGVSIWNINSLLSNRKITARTESDIRKAFANLGQVTSQPQLQHEPVTATFTLTQYGKIHRAMKSRKYSDIQDFFRDAVIEFAEQINAETRKDSKPSNIRDLPQPPAMGKVAEDPRQPGHETDERSA